MSTLEIRALNSCFSRLFAFMLPFYKLFSNKLVSGVSLAQSPGPYLWGEGAGLHPSVHFAMILAPSHGRINVLSLAGLAGRRSGGCAAPVLHAGEEEAYLLQTACCRSNALLTS